MARFNSPPRRDKRFDRRERPGRDSGSGRFERRESSSRDDRREGRDSRDSRDSGRSRSGGSFKDFRERKDRSRGFDRSRGKTEMFPAICDECGKKCEVPFMPTSSKPIFCSNCFEKKDNKKRDDSRDRRELGKTDLKPSLYELDVINRKLDKIMKKLGIE